MRRTKGKTGKNRYEFLVCWAAVMVAAGAGADWRWPAQWQAFGPVPPPAGMIASSGTVPSPNDLVSGDLFRNTVPETVTVNDVAYPAQPVEFVGGLLDLGELFGGVERGRKMYLATTLNVEKDAKYTIHTGANWWMQWWVDGEPVFNTIPDGNRKGPIAVDNHQFTVDLKTGRHVLAVAVIGGSGGFSLAAGGPRESAAAVAAAAGGKGDEKALTFKAVFDRAWADYRGHGPESRIVGSRVVGRTNVGLAAVREEFGRALALAVTDEERARALLAIGACKIDDADWSDWESVRRDYTAVLESEATADQRAEAAVGVAESWMGQGDYGAARRHLERAAALAATPETTAAVRFAGARILMMERNYPAALNALQTLLDDETVPDSIRVQAESGHAGIKQLLRLRPVRPRLFFTAATWPGIAARALGSQHAAFQRLQTDMDRHDLADIRLADWGMEAMNTAFIYRVTGAETDFEKTRTMLHATLDAWKAGEGNNRFYSRAAFAAALDWIWNDLPPAERLGLARDFTRYAYTLYTSRRIRGDLGRIGFYYLHNMYWYAGLGALDPGLDDLDHTRALLVLGRGYLDNLTTWSNYPEWARDDGGTGAFAIGRVVYEYNETPNPVWTFLHCLPSALGEQVPAAWAYLGITPHHALRNVLGIIGADVTSEFGRSLVPGIQIFGFSGAWRRHGGTTGSDMLYSHLGQFIHFFADTHPLEAGIASHLRERIATEYRPGASGIFPVYPFLLNLEEEPPPAVPEGLPLARHFEFRGKVFMSSGFGPDDTYILYSAGGGGMGGHHDATHFSISRGGFLALDTGCRSQTYFGGTSDQRSFYSQQTVAHNCVLVQDPDETVLWSFPRQWRETAVPPRQPIAHTGGQDRPRHLAELLAFESRHDYAYVATDATPTHAQHRSESVLRQFVYLPPSHVVVFDRVTAVQPEFPKRWLLHTANEPVVEGLTFRADQGDGRLFCQTLYPADAQLEVIGGPGREFWASGHNWAIPEDSPYFRTLGMSGPDDIPEAMGRWRVEVRPGTPRREDFFLHLLQTADRTTEEMTPGQPVETAEQIGLSFKDGDREWTVYFAKNGAVGGRIRLEIGGAPVFDQPFTDGIMPQAGLGVTGTDDAASADLVRAAAAEAEHVSRTDILDRIQHDPDSQTMLQLAGGDAADTEQVLTALRSDDSGTRRRAAWALGTTAAPRHVPRLAALLDDDAAEVRLAAATALGMIATNTAENAAAGAALAGALNSTDTDLRAWTARLLGRAGAPAPVTVLAEILAGDDSPIVRAATAEALGKIGGPAAVTALTAALRDHDGRVRRHGTTALETIGAPAVPALVELLTTTEDALRLRATAILAAIGAPATEPVLGVLTTAPDDRARTAAAAALRPGTGDRRAVASLLELAGNEDADVQAAALKALGRVGGAAAAAAIAEALTASATAARTAAAQAMGTLGAAAPVDVLAAALQDREPAVRVAAAVSLGRLADSAGVEPLIAALEDQSPDVRVAAADSLGQIADARAIPHLIEAMGDNVGRVGHTANDALYRITGHRVVIPLEWWGGGTIRQYSKPHWDRWWAEQQKDDSR